MSTVEKKTVAFFPTFYSLGETLPAINIAESYRNKGGNIVFFSNGGRYEKIVEDAGFKIIKLPEIWTRIKNYEENKEKIIKKIDKQNYENRIFSFYEKYIIEKTVQDEIEALKKNKIDLIVNFFNLTAKISAKVLNIPLIVVISGVITPAYYKSGFVTFPDNYENFFTKIIPGNIKNSIAKWYLLNSKLNVRHFNKVAKKYNIPKFRTINDIFMGDINFICDDIIFLGIKPTRDFPEYDFKGPILGRSIGEENIILDNDVEDFLKRKGKFILITLGSTPDRKFLWRILKTLSKTDYNVIAIHHTKNKKLVPKFSDNILSKVSVSSIKELNKRIDIAIIHGGRGTVYTAASSGVPVIGIPNHLEQQFNLDCLVRKGVGLRISKKYFRRDILLKSIEKILNNYDFYKKNAVDLSHKMPLIDGSERMANDILNILEQNQRDF